MAPGLQNMSRSEDDIVPPRLLTRAESNSSVPSLESLSEDEQTPSTDWEEEAWEHPPAEIAPSRPRQGAGEAIYVPVDTLPCS